jgi:hypothetical protein
MVSNVLVNGYTAFIVGYASFYIPLAMQSAFAAFVFWMAWRHWHKSKQMTEAP